MEVYEQSVVQIQSLQEELEGKEKVIQERERELESQTVSNGELSERVTTLSKELQEKDQYYNRQVQSVLPTRVRTSQYRLVSFEYR